MMEGYTEVFAWGGDHFGQLGLGNKHTGKTYSTPRFCSFGILIKEIACGEEHSAFISYSGHVYSMGSNSDGRLGLGTKSQRQSSSPCLVEGLISHRSIKISCGWGHTGVVTEDGSVFTWGVGEFGALGTGVSDNSWYPVKALLPRSMRGLDISCGSRHTGVIVEENTNKTILMTGSGEAGQLGTGKREKEFSFVVVNAPEEIHQIALGVFHTLLLATSGKIYAMGGNSFGQLGIGSKKSCSRPEKVVLDTFVTKIACGGHSAAINDKGQLYLWGTGVFGEYLQPTRMSISSCKNIGIGGSYGIAIDSNEIVYAWGSNSNGELGLGDYDPRITPTSIQALKNKTIKSISCGGSYLLALGLDVVAEYKKENTIDELDSKNSWKKDNNFNKSRIDDNLNRIKLEESSNRYKFEEKPKSVYEKYRNSSLEVERIGLKDNENEIKHREIERINGGYRQIASKYEDLKLELVKTTEKNNQLRLMTQKLEREAEEQKRASEYSYKELTSALTHTKQGLEDSQRQNHALTLEIKTYKDEIQRYKRMIDDIKHSSKLESSQKIEDLNQTLYHKHSIEIHDLKLMQDQESIKKKQLEKNLEISSKHISNLEDSLSRSREEVSQLKTQLNSAMHTNESNKKSLQGEIERYYKDSVELKKKIESISIEKERVSEIMKQELDKYCLDNSDLRRKLEISYNEKEKLNSLLASESERLISENSDLTRRLERLISENSDLNRRIETLTIEKEKSIKHLQTEINALGTEINKLKDHLDRTNSEKQEISNLLAQKGVEVKHIDQDKANIETQLGYYKQNNEDLKYEINKLQHQISEYVYTIDRLNRDSADWEENYKILLDENNILKESVADLENKNRQLFDNLEKELAQRAKEYKERTITMLNTPNRSTSPYLRPNTPMVHSQIDKEILTHNRDKSDDLGNTAARLLESMDSPKSVRTSQYLSIPQVYKGSTTPTKEDVRIRIASLMKNRMRIEEQIQSLNQEN
jgi:X-linked retinitis pigmentosa GTPase regulator